MLWERSREILQRVTLQRPDTVRCAEAHIGSTAALSVSLASSRPIPDCHTDKVKYKPKEIPQFVSQI